MDFDTYETFLENLSSVMSGINRLIQKAKDESGKCFVWSPVAPDIVEEGALDFVGYGPVYNVKAIPQVILEHLNYENFIVELVYYMDTPDGSYYILSIGR